MEVEKQGTLFTKEIDELLEKEKVSRQNNDHIKSAEILTQIVQIAFDLKEYEKLFQLIELLAKKRGQAKRALVDMVQLCMTFIPKIEDINTRLKLIETIKGVSDKKIFLEVEYARCCLMLVKLKETENSIDEAAKILQDVQVETYGSMDRREKIDFILYQMKIMIKKNDLIRLFIISKKINRKNLNDPKLDDLKIIYYSYLFHFYVNEDKYLDCAECYKEIYDTLVRNPEVFKDNQTIEFGFKVDQKTILENYVLFLAITTHSKEQLAHLHDLKTNYIQTLERHPKLLRLVNDLLSNELISTKPADFGFDTVEIFLKTVHHYEQHQKDFRRQLVQHNIRVLEKYYRKIYVARVSELLNVPKEEVEVEICEMINIGLIFAKIDRVSGIISFRKLQNENERLNEWIFDVNKLLDIVDKTCNLISRDNEMLKVK
eukprot:TRINITY_DN1726_c0_g1_i1.p1 TRINITY_DN1726_c0_g1~~TRINITY_DN1726_c0_g1_i1.p1  ORF type:complete len:431 (-),score=65.69 TRINITY_DN1726_c0_g1_i1:170-1462(-)